MKMNIHQRSKEEITRMTVEALMEARVMRRICETVMANLGDEINSKRAAEAGLLKRRVLDMTNEFDASKLTLSDFKPEDFDSAGMILAKKIAG